MPKMLRFGDLLTGAVGAAAWMGTVSSCSLSGMVILGLLPIVLSPLLAILWGVFASRIGSRANNDDKQKPKRWPGSGVAIAFGAVLIVLASWQTGAMASAALEEDIQCNGQLLKAWENTGIVLLTHSYVLSTLSWWAAALVVIAFGVSGSGGSLRRVLLFVLLTALMFPAIVIVAREIVAAGAPITA